MEIKEGVLGGIGKLLFNVKMKVLRIFGRSFVHHAKRCVVS